MSRFCFDTVTDEEFIVAAEVLIHSFVKFNPWFEEWNGLYQQCRNNNKIVASNVSKQRLWSRVNLKKIYSLKHYSLL